MKGVCRENVMPELFVVNGMCGGTVIFLPEVPTVLGRSAECHVQIGDPWISSMHALFERRGEELWVIDLDSRNGTFANEARIKESAVEVGMRLRFGKTVIEIRESQVETGVEPGVLSEQGTIVRYLADLRDELAQVRAVEPRHETMPSSVRPGPSGSTALAAIRRQLAVLSDVSKALVESTGLDDNLARILRAASDAAHAERATLLLMDESGQMVPRVNEPPYSPALVSEALISAAARSRAGILSLDAQQDLRFSTSQSVISQGIRSCLCVPIWADNRILGMLLLDRGLGDPFTAEDLELTALVGYQAAIAIDRARFLDRARLADQRRRALFQHFPPEVAQAALSRESLERDPIDLATRGDALVLHVEMDGANALAEATDPEQVAAFLLAFDDELSKVVFEHWGVLERRARTGFTAFFGILSGDPADRARALRCALSLQERFSRLRGMVQEIGPVGLRIGVEAGKILAGSYGPADTPEFTALGQTVEDAMRLAALAPPGSVAVGPRLRERVGDEFGFAALPKQQPGSTPIEGWELIASVVEVA